MNINFKSQLLIQFAADPDTLKTLTTLLRIAIPPHCTRDGSGVPNLSLGSHCLACVQSVLEKGRGMHEYALQACNAQLARCLLQFLKWDHTASSRSSSCTTTTTTTENYALMGDLAEDGKISLRVYSVSIIRMLLENEHSASHTQSVVTEQFAQVWSAYKEQSLDLFVTETERRRLLLGDVVANFLTN